jgi:phosphatidylserine/phosphatidylglycerophosphate/cardiolipin synthase-like enzyme
MAPPQEEIKRILKQTFATKTFSRSERQAFNEILNENRYKQGIMEFARKKAFNLATKELLNAQSQPAFEWLKEVIQIIHNAISAGVSAQAEVCFSPGAACPEKIIHCLKDARQTVDICVFTITDNRIREEIGRAFTRGCHIRIITDDEKIGNYGSDIRRLATIGIPIKHDGSRSSHMHHKFAIFDGETLLTGSFNWTRGAALENQENLITTNDARLVAPFQKEFEKLWNKFPFFKVDE